MNAPAHRFTIFAPGDPAPAFRAHIGNNPNFNFDTVGGRYVVMGFFGTLADTAGQAAMRLIGERRALFDDDRVAFFGVTSNPADAQEGRARDQPPGLRYVHDYDGKVARLFGSLPLESETQSGLPYRRQWIVLDPQMRTRAVFPFRDDGREAAGLIAHIEALPPLDQFAGFAVHAPVLVLRDVFEPELCARLIGLYEQQGGAESGFMREVDGKTVVTHDYKHKRRSDYHIADPDLIALLQRRVKRRIVPEIRKAHQFDATRMERYIIGCYEAETSGHFAAHRDNTTKGTAHRRFALSVNLNSDFEGGELSFPEFGARPFKPPAGTGVVFSCSLLHQVSAVTRGRRFAFLPFLYDDAAAKLREASNPFLGEGVAAYKA